MVSERDRLHQELCKEHSGDHSYEAYTSTDKEQKVP